MLHLLCHLYSCIVSLVSLKGHMIFWTCIWIKQFHTPIVRLNVVNVVCCRHVVCAKVLSVTILHNHSVCGNGFKVMALGTFLLDAAHISACHTMLIFLEHGLNSLPLLTKCLWGILESVRPLIWYNDLNGAKIFVYFRERLPILQSVWTGTYGTVGFSPFPTYIRLLTYL